MKHLSLRDGRCYYVCCVVSFPCVCRTSLLPRSSFRRCGPAVGEDSRVESSKMSPDVMWQVQDIVESQVSCVCFKIFDQDYYLWYLHQAHKTDGKYGNVVKNRHQMVAVSKGKHMDLKIPRLGQHTVLNPFSCGKSRLVAAGWSTTFPSPSSSKIKHAAECQKSHLGFSSKPPHPAKEKLE